MQVRTHTVSYWDNYTNVVCTIISATEQKKWTVTVQPYYGTFTLDKIEKETDKSSICQTFNVFLFINAL